MFCVAGQEPFVSSTSTPLSGTTGSMTYESDATTLSKAGQTQKPTPTITKSPPSIPTAESSQHTQSTQSSTNRLPTTHTTRKPDTPETSPDKTATSASQTTTTIQLSTTSANPTAVLPETAGPAYTTQRKPATNATTMAPMTPLANPYGTLVEQSSKDIAGQRY